MEAGKRNTKRQKKVGAPMLKINGGYTCGDGFVTQTIAADFQNGFGPTKTSFLLSHARV
jgi:hypothetical protein